MEDYKLPESFRAGQASFFLMNIQSIVGIRFDERKGLSLLVKLHNELQQIKEEVEPQLPPRKMKKGEAKEYTLPAKPYKKDGSFSAHMFTFIEKHNLSTVGDNLLFEGELFPITGGLVLDKKVPMLISNGDDLKEWFLELGWVPTMWNYKKDSNGKPVREPNTNEMIVTSPKIQDKGKICPNLIGLDKGDLCAKVVKWLSLRNRYAVLKGWLENERLAIDGRLSSGSTGITPTHRQKHSVVANIPKAEEGVLYGKEFRSLFVSDNNESVCVGYDASALEARVEGHYTTPYDGGVRADELLNGDVHSKNAKLFFPKETELFDPSAPDFNKDDKRFKPYRSRSKNGAYALTLAHVKLCEFRGKLEQLILSQAKDEYLLKVQRLSRRGVHLSRWKRTALTTVMI